LSTTRERLIDLWRGFVFLVMFDKLNINRLIGADTHKMERSTALANHSEVCSILSIIKSAKFSIFNTESVLPEM
jgi:hypothetical protein